MTIKTDAPIGRNANGDCPGTSCVTCWLEPKEGRCPFFNLVMEQKRPLSKEKNHANS